MSFADEIAPLDELAQGSGEVRVIDAATLSQRLNRGPAALSLAPGNAHAIVLCDNQDRAVVGGCESIVFDCGNWRRRKSHLGRFGHPGV